MLKDENFGFAANVMFGTRSWFAGFFFRNSNKPRSLDYSLTSLEVNKILTFNLPLPTSRHHLILFYAGTKTQKA